MRTRPRDTSGTHHQVKQWQLGKDDDEHMTLILSVGSPSLLGAICARRDNWVDRAVSVAGARAGRGSHRPQVNGRPSRSRPDRHATNPLPRPLTVSSLGSQRLIGRAVPTVPSPLWAASNRRLRRGSAGRTQACGCRSSSGRRRRTSFSVSYRTPRIWSAPFPRGGLAEEYSAVSAPTGLITRVPARDLAGRGGGLATDYTVTSHDAPCNAMVRLAAESTTPVSSGAPSKHVRKANEATAWTEGGS